MLTVADVPLSQSALLVIDAQDSFKTIRGWERRNNREFETNVGALIEAFRKAGRPVLFFLHTDGDPGFETDSPHYKLMSFITPRPGEPTFHKNTRNCFTSTALGPQLLEHGIRRLAITGIQMEQCCETTARVAADLGYAVDFVIDGTMTFPIPDSEEPGRELAVQDIEERTRFVLNRRFARVTTTAVLINELAAASR